DDEGRKDQRRDDGADQAQEDSAQHLELFGKGREVMANFRADQNSDHNPRGQRAAGPGVCNKRGQGDPAGYGQKLRIDGGAGVAIDGPKYAGDPGKRQESEQESALVRGFCVHLSKSSSSMELSVFWSRYFTMTGVYSASPH